MCIRLELVFLLVAGNGVPVFGEKLEKLPGTFVKEVELDAGYFVPEELPIVGLGNVLSMSFIAEESVEVVDVIRIRPILFLFFLGSLPDVDDCAKSIGIPDLQGEPLIPLFDCDGPVNLTCVNQCHNVLCF